MCVGVVEKVLSEKSGPNNYKLNCALYMKFNK